MLITPQFRWFGHILRMDDIRIPKQIFFGQLSTGTRSIGRPPLRYKDTLIENLKSCKMGLGTWKALAGGQICIENHLSQDCPYIWGNQTELRNYKKDVLDERLTPLCLNPLLNICTPDVAVQANPRLVQPHTRDAANLATQPQTAEHSSFEAKGETTHTNSVMNQSEFEGNECNRRQARENTCDHVMIGFGLVSHWLKRWDESKTKAITKSLSTLNWKPLYYAIQVGSLAWVCSWSKPLKQSDKQFLLYGANRFLIALNWNFFLKTGYLRKR